MRCSAPPPPVVIANRTVAPPARGVRNMLVVVLLPKSKMRFQLGLAARFTQAANVKLAHDWTRPSGKSTNCAPPAMRTALPMWPPTNVAPLSVPVRPLPEVSVSEVPDVWSAG